VKINPGPPPLPPKGFRFAGVAGGLKKTGQRDVALIVADKPSVCAAVFTQNRAAAPPVSVAREHVATGRIRAVLVNSGAANASTGEQGFETARWSCARVAKHLACEPEQVLPCSTGVIGVQINRRLFGKAIDEAAAALDVSSFKQSAEAIMTSDAFSKWAGRTVKLSGGKVRVAAMAKGAGMIQPNMATMLSFVLTDADLSAPVAKRMLRDAIANSFNRITIDADTSTNDTTALIASAAADHTKIRATRGRDYELLAAAVTSLCDDLSRMIVRDGEGATKMVDVIVEGAKNDREAERGARGVANSVLVKCAFTGADPNWGRILMALGNSEIALTPEIVNVRVGGKLLVKQGREPSAAALRAAQKIMGREAFELRVDLGLGSGRAVVVTSDLTTDYVHFNSAYTS
jgi:glutamate N-acetyltransferase/amino-acid N-acetyltransferase